jgi:hypothetical protein
MSNSHSNQYLLGLYKAVLEDCRGTFPGLRKELERDNKRLISLVATRGLRVLTLDLPAVGKELDRSLADGRLTLSSSYLTSRRRKGSPIPRLFGALVMRVFDDSGMLVVDPDTDAIRFLRQLYLLAKKWKATCEKTYTFKEVWEFYRVDQELKSPTFQWNEPYLADWNPDDVTFVGHNPLGEDLQKDLFPDSKVGKEDISLQVHGLDALGHDRLVLTLQRVADILSTSLGEFEPSIVLAKHGPGVVSDLHKLASKYEFPTWSERLEGVFQQARFAFANYGLWAEYVSQSKLDEEIEESSLNGTFRAYPFTARASTKRFEGIEMYSKLIAVPKTQKGPRLIASEPTANQWCQQIVRAFLHDKAKKSWIGKAINFHDQTPNQLAALVASRDASMSTIDLSAASDRMSCWVVERLFRRNPSLLRALHASRTFVIRNLVDKKSPEFYYLRKFSTMGSAVTFPVQSLCFLTVAIAAAHWVDNKKPTIRSCKAYAEKTRVFGDDIIVKSEYTDSTLYLLQHLGFKVNTSKTYTGASCFRESCGVEAYKGVDVTPSYALMVPRRSAPNSLVSNVAMAHNFFNKKLMAAAAFIQRATTGAGLTDLPLVKSGSGVFGWPDVMGFDYSHLRSRWNNQYHRIEYLARSVTWRSTRRDDRGPSRLLQYFVEAPAPENIFWMSGVAVKGVALTRPRWVPQEV